MPKPNTGTILSWICAPCGGCGRRKGENEIKALRKTVGVVVRSRQCRNIQGQDKILVMVFKRILHPVGQGAFFTEQFYDESGKVVYNVVYDCGSKSSGIQKQMERTIESTLHDKKTIDAMFLSHFDDDHINFVNYLKTNGHLSGTRLFIPMLKEEEKLGIEPYFTNYRYILSLNDKTANGTRVIKVGFDGDDESERKPDEEDISLRGHRVIEEIEDDKISSGTPLIPNVFSVTGFIWYYTPFNVRFKTLITEFKSKLKAINLSYNKLRNKQYVTEHLGELKKVYQDLGKNPPKGTAINLNSLLVMSYPDKVERCKEYGNNMVCEMYFPEWYRWNIGYTRYWLAANQLYPGSCLYTGDTSANDPVVWKRIENIISKCLGAKRRLTLMQVPHHGSKYSYDSNMVRSLRSIGGWMYEAGFYG